MILKATAGVDIDDGVYPATLLGLDARENAESTFQSTTYLRWTFLVVRGMDDTVEMSANSSMAFGPKAKARRWWEALLGAKIAAGDEFDPATHCPRECQVLIKRDVESGYCRIEDVMGAKGKPKAAKPVVKFGLKDQGEDDLPELLR